MKHNSYILKHFKNLKKVFLTFEKMQKKYDEIF